MTIRLLAPAGPVSSGRSVTVSARLRVPAVNALATWQWEDGGHDQVAVASGAPVRARCTHRYAAPGVYRVRVQLEETSEDRYVTVARSGQVAASGWVRDVERGERIAFGFLISPGADGHAGAVQLRALIAGVELATTHIEWLITSQPGSLHFGGIASLEGEPPTHPYRVDVLRTAAERGRSMQRLTMSVYAPDAVPGHDSPMHRVSGRIRPGRVNIVGTWAASQTDS